MRWSTTYKENQQVAQRDVESHRSVHVILCAIFTFLSFFWSVVNVYRTAALLSSYKECGCAMRYQYLCRIPVIMFRCVWRKLRTTNIAAGRENQLKGLCVSSTRHRAILHTEQYVRTVPVLHKRRNPASAERPFACTVHCTVRSTVAGTGTRLLWRSATAITTTNHNGKNSMNSLNQ